MHIDYKNHTTLTISGIPYTGSELLHLCRQKLQESNQGNWEPAFYGFISEWINNNPFVTVKTSGSTGKPKTIQVAKSAMLQSAFNTLEFFSLKPGMSALLCLSCEYIAGKMMVVRALAGNLNLIPVPVTGKPLSLVQEKVDFAALTPLQMSNEPGQHPSKVHLLRTVILGGSSVGEELTKQLQNHPFEAWETYGMTETLSHIALRRINGPNKQQYFTPLPHISVSQDKRGCLTVHAPEITEQEVVTNDIAEVLSNGKFRIKGRIDNIINSGGIKISPEEIENQISDIVQQPFYVSSLPHPQLGNELVLVVEKQPENEGQLLEEIKKAVPPYHAPRKILVRNPLPRTDNGKIKRRLNE
jgi:O-succinylbenzoic acid--CoA ligase